MVYFQIRTAKNENIGHTTYFSHSAARKVAARLAGKYAKIADNRGSGIKIVKIESDKLYDGETVMEWFNY